MEEVFCRAPLLLGLLFVCVLLRSVLAQGGTCKFLNSDDKELTGILYCHVSENTKIGDVASCKTDVYVKNYDDVTVVEKDKKFLVQMEEERLHFAVNYNITKSLQDAVDDSMDSKLLLISCDAFCKPGDTTFSAYISIVVENNHPPEFSSDLYVYKFPETALPNHVINDENPIVVVDRDYRKEPVSLVTVTFKSGNENRTFELLEEERSGSQYPRTFDVKIKLLQGLTYSKEGYHLTLFAKDNGKDSKNSTTTVKIEVQDVDNQDPVFKDNVYTANVQILEEEGQRLFVSNANLGEKVEFSLDGTEFRGNLELQLSPRGLFAYDQDEGINATIHYELISEDVPFASYFELGKVDPKLTFRAINPDLLKRKSISLLIKAYQEDNPKRHAYSMINIMLETILIGRDLIFLQRVNLLRTQAPDVTFYTIENSQDVSVKNNLQYDIKGKDADKVKLVNANQLQLKEALSNDVTTLEIDVAMTSHGAIFQRSNDMKMVLHVIDRTPAESLFNKDVYVVDIPSNAVVQSELFEITTTENNVDLHIKGIEPANGKDLFALKGNKLILNGALEAVTKQYNVSLEGVRPTDDKNDFATVILRVVVALKPPESLFKREVYEVDVLSDAIVDKMLLQIGTTFDGVATKIQGVEPSSAENLFRLEENNLILSGNLDESVLNYTIFVEGNIEQRKDSARVVVHVVWIKKAPDALFSHQLYTVEAASDVSINSVLFELQTSPGVRTTLKGTDPVGAVKLFSLQDNKISISKQLDESTKEYRLFVEGILTSDGRNDSSEVVLHVVKIRKSAEPLFAKQVYNVDVQPETPQSTEIFELENAVPGVTTSLTNSEPPDAINDVFKLNDNKVILVGKLDDSTGQYTLFLDRVLKDENRHDSSKIVVHVGKCTKPGDQRFEKCIYTSRINKSAKKGHTVVKFTESTMNYYMLSGNEGNDFAFEPKNTIVLNKDMDKLTKDVYYIMLSTYQASKTIAHLQGVPELKTDQALLVVVVDRDPIFLHPHPLVKTLPPHSLLSDYVFQIQVKPVGLEPTFTLKGSIKFAVNAETGLVYPLRDVTKEEDFKDTFTIGASYNSNQTAELQIYVFGLRWSQTLKLTMNFNGEYVDLNNIERKISDITEHTVTAMTYEFVEEGHLGK